MFFLLTVFLCGAALMLNKTLNAHVHPKVLSHGTPSCCNTLILYSAPRKSMPPHPQSTLLCGTLIQAGYHLGWNRRDWRSWGSGALAGLTAQPNPSQALGY